ncbi:hypothetical protein SMC26_39575 [Actinomadura fulvescens]|uniref:Uncharacterized protein n=1 Tax=Actinomadura fulvescens TaxID=46160 RepID=A0ABN3Q209_9ACTN
MNPNEIYDAGTGHTLTVEIDGDGDLMFDGRDATVYVRPDELVKALRWLGVLPGGAGKEATPETPSDRVRAAWRASASVDGTERATFARHAATARSHRRARENFREALRDAMERATPTPSLRWEAEERRRWKEATFIGTYSFRSGRLDVEPPPLTQTRRAIHDAHAQAIARLRQMGLH